WNVDLVNYYHLFGDTGFNGPIWLYFLKQQLYAIAGSTVLGLFVMLVSSHTRYPLIPAFLGGTAFMLPFVIIFVKNPSEWLIRLLFGLFPYMEFIQLDRLDSNMFYSFLGNPVLYANALIG